MLLPDGTTKWVFSLQLLTSLVLWIQFHCYLVMLDLTYSKNQKCQKDSLFSNQLTSQNLCLNSNITSLAVGECWSKNIKTSCFNSVSLFKTFPLQNYRTSQCKKRYLCSLPISLYNAEKIFEFSGRDLMKFINSTHSRIVSVKTNCIFFTAEASRWMLQFTHTQSGATALILGKSPVWMPAIALFHRYSVPHISSIQCHFYWYNYQSNKKFLPLLLFLLARVYKSEILRELHSQNHISQNTLDRQCSICL